MRNEIFSQIKQNRNKYYSELKKSDGKKSKPEKRIKIPSESGGIISNQNEQVIPNKNIKIQIPKIHLNVDSIKYAGRSTSKITLGYIMKGNSWINNLNQLLIDHTGIVTQRFYDITCKLFEDPGDTEDYSEELGFRKPQANLHERPGTLNFVGVNQYGSMALNASYISSQERFMLWLNKQYQRIILFFEADELTEIKEVKLQKLEPKEISINERRTDSKTSIIEMNDGSESAEIEKKVNTVFRRLFSLLFNHPIITSVNIMSTVELIMIFGKKTLFMIFPIINRFI